MKIHLIKTTLAATLGIAITLTLSCSSPEGGGGNSGNGDNPSGNSSGGGEDGNGVGSSSSSGGRSSSSSATGSSIIHGTPVTYGGETYQTIVLGSQTWMAKNLNYNASGSVCYNNQYTNCEKYGRLYDWATAKTVCPSGWHLPSDAEWTTLTDFVGGESTAGNKLKATSGWNEGGNGTDAYGFSALPGGAGSSGGDFGKVGNEGNWWSSSENNAANAWLRNIRHYLASVYRVGIDKTYLGSVRCVKD
jgi:uncharacterized protein (TIGR02145 family)